LTFFVWCLWDEQTPLLCFIGSVGLGVVEVWKCPPPFCCVLVLSEAALAHFCFDGVVRWTCFGFFGGVLRRRVGGGTSHPPLFFGFFFDRHCGFFPPCTHPHQCGAYVVCGDWSWFGCCGVLGWWLFPLKRCFCGSFPFFFCSCTEVFVVFCVVLLASRRILQQPHLPGVA